jgi:hypothetical protein
MDDKQKEWYEQYSVSFGAREFFRFGCVFFIWMFMGIVLTFMFRSSTMLILFLVFPFMFAIVAQRWKPAYLLLRKIWGNENLPLEPMPRSTVKIHRQPLTWYGYLPGIWGLLMLLLLLYTIWKR